MERNRGNSIESNVVPIRKNESDNSIQKMSTDQLIELARLSSVDSLNDIIDETWEIGDDGKSFKLDSLFEIAKAHKIGENDGQEGKSYIAGLNKIKKILEARHELKERRKEASQMDNDLKSA